MKSKSNGIVSICCHARRSARNELLSSFTIPSGIRTRARLETLFSSFVGGSERWLAQPSKTSRVPWSYIASECVCLQLPTKLCYGSENISRPNKHERDAIGEIGGRMRETSFVGFDFLFFFNWIFVTTQ